MDKEKISLIWALLFIIILLVEVPAMGGDFGPLRFRKISPEGNLGNRGVKSITQDSAGFIWFNTSDELCRYDAYQIVKYNTFNLGIEVASFGQFGNVFCDNQGILWVSTSKGLLKYNYPDGTFEIQFTTEENIVSLAKDRNDQLLFITERRLGFYRPADNQPSYIPLNDSDNFTLSSLYCDEFTILVGTSKGKILSFDYRSERLKPFSDSETGKPVIDIERSADQYLCLIDEVGLLCLNGMGGMENKFDFFLTGDKNITKSIYLDKSGIIWIGTQRGLYLLNHISGEHIHYLRDSNEQFSLPNNSVWCFYEDKQGGVWIGTFAGGVAYTNEFDHQFHHVSIESSNTNTNDLVSSLTEDAAGNLWIGTEGDGLYYYNRNSGQFMNYMHHADRNSLSYNNVKALEIDQDGKLWIGAYKGGLDCYNMKRNVFTHYNDDPESDSGQKADYIYDIELEPDSGLWIARKSGWIDFFHFEKRTFTHIATDLSEMNIIYSNLINGLFRGSGDRLWIASRNGLLKYEIKSKRFSHYYFNRNDTISLGSNETYCVYEQRDTIWVGSRFFGLFSFDPKNEVFCPCPVQENQGELSVYSILSDADQNLWFSSDKGLYKMESAKGKFSRYNIDDGLQEGSFYPNASTKCSTGEIVFGGINGFSIFHPQSIKKNTQQPDVRFTGLFINNERVEYLSSADNRQKTVDYIKEITLKHNQKVFSIEFTALNYLISQKNTYAYKLFGYDHGWNYTSSGSRLASYSNLPPGDYSLSVKGSNNDGVWGSSEKSIDIIILPPFWRNKWAFLVYLALMLIGSLAVHRILEVRREYETKIRIERISKKNLKELNKTKIQFFTNISHEFKTPLTLILAPLKSLLNSSSDFDAKSINYLELINRNVIRLQSLFDQLMTFRAIEDKKQKINWRQGDIVDFLKQITTLFVPLMNESGIHLAFESAYDKLPAYFDYDKYEKIFFNLISNAVRYTNSEGHIIIYIQTSEEITEDRLSMIKVSVINTGAIISESDLDKVFDNYFGVADNPTRHSSGIGLAFTKELVTLLGGTVEASSNEIETCFNVQLPIRRELRTDPEGGDQELQSYNLDFSRQFVSSLSQKAHNESLSEKQSSNPKLLIIEDNADLQDYLSKFLADDYQIYSAMDGEKGLKMAKEIQPELILSDIMLPKIDGIGLCNRIKSDISISHIPVILLSVLSSQENINKGMKAGGDVYIEKPFDPEYLKLQIKNLISFREAVRKAFSGDINLEPERITITSTDDAFIKQAIKSVEDQMGNSEYSVDHFVSDMALSRTLLYKKIKSLTNLTINDFIANVRMKRAAQLLRDSDLTVSEVAYHVGYNDSRYFSTCFKKYFHISPSKYKEGMLS